MQLSPFLERVARHILSCHADDLPDLRRATVLLPNYHVAGKLAQALSATANLPTLLLPQMVTLNDWAQSAPLDAPVLSDTRRSTALYQALRERRWFADADLWSLSRELLALMDELTRSCVALPASEAEFATQLVAAYQARSGAAMQFEARVVHELWYAMASGKDTDAVAAYQQRLAQLARQAHMPLYVLQTGELAAPDVRFLDACALRVPVTVFDLRAMVTDAPDCALLAQALQPGADDLRRLAAMLKYRPDAALGQRLQFIAAHGLEQEAEAADRQIRNWLSQGRQSIAVVVQDRLVARRVRALLERSEVLVQDETGWTFATLSVSTVLMRWLDVLHNDFYYQDLLDLFKSPFLFDDDRTAWRLEQMVRKHGVVAHLENYIDIATRESPELIVPLARLRQAAQALSKKSATLAEWLSSLHDSLDILGVLQGWAADAAGQQLLGLLSAWLEELRDDKARFSIIEWRRWLSLQLDLHTFRDTAVESPVLFTHLAATRWRSFDAVLLLGCDAGHLPAPADAGQWFNDAVRASLGLPLCGAQQMQQRDDLLGLLAINHTVLATWQATRNGQPNLLSPHLEMLRALHLLAYGTDLVVSEHNVRFPLPIPLPQAGEGEYESLREFHVRPHPAATPALIPQHITPSGYNSLVVCPYQFYARHILRLNELDEVREELDKRDYGTWVHAVLQRFHSAYPLLHHHQREDLLEQLQRIGREVFADALAHDYLAQAWLMRWQALAPTYLDWQSEHEQTGWRYSEAEAPFDMLVAEKLNLRGRIDRIDRRVDDPERLCVLDYKTQTATRLKGKLKDAGEDVQLACYALARHAEAAAFVSLDGEKVVAVAPVDDLGELAQLNLLRLQTVFEQLRDGAGLPAHGAESVCQHCEMNGLCRHGYWEAHE